MGLFSFLKEAWKESTYEVNNKFFRLGTVLRVSLPGSVYRYGIFVGKNRIILAQYGNVKQVSFHTFQDGCTFLSSGWVEPLYFTTKRQVHQSCKCAVEMCGNVTKMDNKEFVMYCRTGNSRGLHESTGDRFSLDALKINKDEESISYAKTERKKIRSAAIKKTIVEYRKQIIVTAQRDCNRSYGNMFMINMDDNLSISTNPDKLLSTLISITKDIDPNSNHQNPDYTIPLNFDDVDVIVKRIVNSAEKRHKTSGLYNGICYIKKNDKFLKEQKKIRLDAISDLSR